LVYLFDVIDTKIMDVLSDLIKLKRPNLKLIVVCNKMDKNPYFDPNWLIDFNNPLIPEYYLGEINSELNYPELDKNQIITLSAKHSMNVPYLKEKLYDLVAEGAIQTDNVIVSNARHFEALQKSYESLDDVLRGMSSGVTTDFVAMDIRRSLHHLGEITGDISTDDLLDTIFSKFCIGK
jgi:tRNA modification GTPase